MFFLKHFSPLYWSWLSSSERFMFFLCCVGTWETIVSCLCNWNNYCFSSLIRVVLCFRTVNSRGFAFVRSFLFSKLCSSHWFCWFSQGCVWSNGRIRIGLGARDLWNDPRKQNHGASRIRFDVGRKWAYGSRNLFFFSPTH